MAEIAVLSVNGVNSSKTAVQVSPTSIVTRDRQQPQQTITSNALTSRLKNKSKDYGRMEASTFSAGSLTV